MTRRKLIARYDLRNPSLRLPETGFALTVQEAPEAPAKAPEGVQEPDPRQVEMFATGANLCAVCGIDNHDSDCPNANNCDDDGHVLDAIDGRCLRCGDDLGGV